LCPKLSKRDTKWIVFINDGYALTNTHLYETNLFGRLIWEMCDGKKNLNEIYKEVELMLLDYFADDITEELMIDIKKEALRFLEVMEKEQLIEWKEK